MPTKIRVAFNVWDDEIARKFDDLQNEIERNGFVYIGGIKVLGVNIVDQKGGADTAVESSKDSPTQQKGDD